MNGPQNNGASYRPRRSARNSAQMFEAAHHGPSLIFSKESVVNEPFCYLCVNPRYDP